MEITIHTEEIRRPTPPSRKVSRDVGQAALESVGSSLPSKSEPQAGHLFIQPGQTEQLVNLNSATGTTAVPYGW